MRRNIYRYHKVTECLFESEQGDYGAGKWSVDQIFTLKQISETVVWREMEGPKVNDVEMNKI